MWHCASRLQFELLWSNRGFYLHHSNLYFSQQKATLTQCWFNVGPPSSMLARPKPNFWSTSGILYMIPVRLSNAKYSITRNNLFWQIKHPTVWRWWNLILYLFSREDHTRLNHRMSAFIINVIVIFPTLWIPHIILPIWDIVFITNVF